MAKKKTVVQEFKELLQEQSKTVVLTPEQQQKIRDLNEKINDIKYRMYDQREESDLGAIMFDIGQSYNELHWCEYVLDEIIEMFPKLNKEDNDDYDY